LFAFDPNETPYDLHFRVGSVPVRVQPWFWLVSALLGWGLAQGLAGDEGAVVLGYVLLWIACSFFSILLHELGHVWMGQAFGSRGHIVLFSFGGLAIGSSDQSARWKRVLVYFAGPGIQLLLWLLLWGLGEVLLAPLPRDARGRLVEWGRPVAAVYVMLSFINLWWPILNLLPVWPLDGGRITRELCEAGSPRSGTEIFFLISAGFSGVLALHCLLGQTPGGGLPFLRDWFQGSLFSGIFFAMFCLQSIQLYQLERSRRRPWNDDRMPWE
jgi:Zn-dependent protease